MSLQDKASEFLASLAGKSIHSKLGFKLLASDPVLDTFRKLGYKVVEYDVPPYPLWTAGIIAVRMLSFIVGSAAVAFLLYHQVAVKSQAGKWFSILSLVASLLAWPMLTGRSGVMLLDFWRPALGFRSCLLVWDIFHIRTVQEVKSWSFARFFAQLWTFPKELDEIAERTAEEGYQRNARLENLKGMPKVAVEAVAMFGALYFIPPYELTRNMSQLAYHCYCDALGVCILMALALFGDGLLKLLGILIDVEMADMFENPLGTTNIRLFWSHWNRAIATVLHRVVFGGGKTKTTLRKKKAAAEAQAAKKQRFSHMDGLSETDAGHTSGEEDHSHANGDRKRNTTGLKPLSSVNGDTQVRKRKNANEVTSAGKPNGNGNAIARAGGAPAKKSSFLPKAAAAIVTFAMSGIFHEHITYFTLGFANGENFVFFLLNGFATVTATWFKRTYPELNAKIPTWLSVLMLHAFFLAVIPLFCSPFIRSGFFVQLEALRYELMPIRDRPRGSFVYLFGQ
ncbi:uncharacterized protein UMAG_05952 [Mycosarcoma maydis]|uniref:Wax synthase domain-containing protein n=1 Tax=Mycosarcoma maydis TaxID=5270 RepID=A0A0D1DQF1_MYCMD|nr:uncharacterized protein UMAG_05952 [Ustilago maydis 521]KIS66216.1 hypothetical protein UMAG_05952 [Ustilago maydis 521]|eukprot:XP_011392282.1 hypothetical protein UMAG_05952 [Ustilago maydis 521]